MYRISYSPHARRIHLGMWCRFSPYRVSCWRWIREIYDFFLQSKSGYYAFNNSLDTGWERARDIAQNKFFFSFAVFFSLLVSTKRNLLLYKILDPASMYHIDQRICDWKSCYFLPLHMYGVVRYNIYHKCARRNEQEISSILLLYFADFRVSLPLSRIKNNVKFEKKSR